MSIRSKDASCAKPERGHEESKDSRGGMLCQDKREKRNSLTRLTQRASGRKSFFMAEPLAAFWRSRRFLDLMISVRGSIKPQLPYQGGKGTHWTGTVEP